MKSKLHVEALGSVMGLNNCLGWWQQAGFGRQAMKNLQLGISGSRVWGSGADIIAPFSLEGRLRDDGAVEVVKQYEGKHSVLYVGKYDGEGTLYGTWDISGYQGEWSIKFTGPSEGHSNEIQEILPVGKPS